MAKMFSLARAVGFSLVLSGCTTLDFDGYRQAVRVITKRPGAEIYSNGELLGVTPAVVSIRRAPHPRIEPKYPGSTHPKRSQARSSRSIARWGTSPNSLAQLVWQVYARQNLMGRHNSFFGRSRHLTLRLCWHWIGRGNFLAFFCH